MLGPYLILLKCCGQWGPLAFTKLFAGWVIVHDFLSPSDFFQITFLRKLLSGIPSESQTLWTQIRPDILSGLIWVQTVCKDYQHMTETPLACKKLNILAEKLFTVMVCNKPLSMVCN